WVQRDGFAVGDATVDWSAGGMAYEAVIPITLPHITDLEIMQSSDPSAGISFSDIDFLTTPAFTDQPNLTVVNANGVDQIYVGFGAGIFYPQRRCCSLLGKWRHLLEHSKPRKSNARDFG